MNKRIEFIISARDLTSKALTGVRGGLAKLKSTVLSLKGLAVGAGLTLGIKQALSTFGTFESALVDMGRVTGEAFGAVKDRIMALPEALGSATELMKGYYQVISAGVKGVKAQMDTLVVASKTAKAAHIEQAEVIKGVTKFLAGYEGQVRTATEAADLLFTIEKEGQTSVAELIPYIGGLAKISNTLNVSQYELGGALATVSQTAGSTAEAVTQYEAVLAGIVKPSEQMIAFLRSLGYETGEQAIKAMGFVGVLRAIQEATGGSSVALGELLGRKEAIKGFLALGSEGFSTLEEKIAAMPEGIGAMDKAWKDYEGSLNGLWDTFKNTVVAMVIETVGKHAPEIKSALAGVTRAVRENKDEIVSFATQGGRFLLDLAKVAAYGAGAIMDSWQGLKMLWLVLGIAFREFEHVVYSGLERLAHGATWFMEKFNIGGVFDGALEKSRGFQAEMKTMLDIVDEEWGEMSDELRDMADEGILPNIRRAAELVEVVEKAAAGFDNLARAADGASEAVAKATAPAGVGEAAAPGGAGALPAGGGTVDLFGGAAGENPADEMLKSMVDERVATETEGMNKIANAEDNIATRRLAAMQGFYGNMTALQGIFGRKGVMLAKAAAIPQTIMSTREAAVQAYKALAGIPIIGPALGVAAAAAAIAFGGQQLGIIKSQGYGQAHAGLEAVPEDATYVLKRGERVLASDQNRDLTHYLESKRDRGGDSRGDTDRPLVVNLYLDGTRFARIVAPSIRKAARDGTDFGFEAAKT